MPDPFGHHFLNCRRGGEVILRHNALRQCFASIIQSSGHSVQQEVPISAASSTHTSSGNLRFDIIATSSASLHNISADVTVTNPLSGSPAILARNATNNGNACTRAERRKESIYSGVSAGLGRQFVPLAIEVFGRLGAKCDSFLKQLASSAIANYAGVDSVIANKLHASLIHLWKIKISCILQKGNSKIIHMGSSRILHRSMTVQNGRQPIDFNALQERYIL
jgi:hypothetical protein